MNYDIITKNLRNSIQNLSSNFKEKWSKVNVFFGIFLAYLLEKEFISILMTIFFNIQEFCFVYKIFSVFKQKNII